MADPVDVGSATGFGGGDGSTSPFSMSGNQLLGLGGGAAALGGLGFLLGQGPSPLPQQYQQLQGGVAGIEQQGQVYNADAAALLSQGQSLTSQGQDTLRRAESGALTPEQQAGLSQTQHGLTNQAKQMYASMGRNPEKDTSYINTQANIDEQVTALGQKYIQSSIALGLGEIQAGQGFAGLGAQYGQLGLGYQSEADRDLIAAGDAQLKQNATYTSALSAAFGAIGSVAGLGMKAFLV